MICIMFWNTLYNITVITSSGFSGGIASLFLHDLYRFRSLKNQNYDISINTITQMFNTGFYIGSSLGVWYILNGYKLYK